MKKTLITVVVLLVFGMGVLGVSFAVEPESGIYPITETSLCPVVGCASGTCHGFADVPQPDGVHEMVCPEAACASLECHAWDTLFTRYHQASDASLNIWILMPVVLVVVLVAITRLLSKNNGLQHQNAQDVRVSSNREEDTHE
ncbi:hypothetical protein [Adlercreutzia sp. ZJ304]|uniref:hypothetical protein n=1 Tax=Adlercreutzia sp. ZJ304 TaxID=2709791 RepID=UPI001F1506C1|nr:hypothetical protein [Adlercreutzia sp. ZJ304]